MNGPNVCENFAPVTVFQEFRASRLGLSLSELFYTGVIKVKRNQVNFFLLFHYFQRLNVHHYILQPMAT